MCFSEFHSCRGGIPVQVVKFVCASRIPNASIGSGGILQPFVEIGRIAGGGQAVDIVDAQVHIGADGVATTLAQMNALGIAAAFLDEFWLRDSEGHPQPGYEVPGGAWRRINPMAEQAALIHPDRFSYLLRIDRKDPDLPSLIALARTTPYARAMRIMPIPEIEQFANGAYNALCEMAEGAGLPVFVMISGKVELLPRYLTNFPRLTFIVDHCGMPWQPGHLGYFDEVLKLASYPNVALKWAHAQGLFAAPAYPYDDILPYLRRAIDAFGASRIMWASDHSQIKGHSWANLLCYLRDSNALSATEKEWILGRSLRSIVDWPAP
jgi:predicted TIM-barrel fold metal-dependent hydrolase